MNNKCQIFTPDEICEQMLNLANYNNNLYGKKVLENSCGDGHILTKIVKRYILSCLKSNKTVAEIKKGLENDIYAFEIDNCHRLNCLNLLNSIVYDYGIENVKWKILKKDYLKSEIGIKFDYIIGNPPYISYRDLDKDVRDYIKKKYNTCSIGKFDYCYAFIEKSIIDLDTNGILVYIIPNSIFKNQYANLLRDYIKSDIIEIYDYKNHRVFPNALTSSAIIKIKQNSKKNNVLYFDYSKRSFKKISKNKLEQKWCFDTNELKENNDKEIISFSSLFKCSVSIATLLNKVFIIDNYEEDDNYLYNGKIKIEKEILKNAISPRNKNYGKKEKIIFPYKYLKNNTLYRFSEEEFSKLYPMATKYLQLHREELDNRCSDKGSKWFEYGRSQALSHLNQKKLLISTVVTNKVKVYLLDKFDIPYSGIYIVSKNDTSLLIAKKILESNKFYNYVCNVGINASGDSLRITPKDIMNFQFTKKEYEIWKN